MVFFNSTERLVLQFVVLYENIVFSPFFTLSQSGNLNLFDLLFTNCRFLFSLLED